MRETMLFALGFALLAAASAEARQGPGGCGARESIVRQLAETYGEHRRSVGLGANNTVVEVFASEETGTWTITVTRPDGTMCLLASGRAYQDLPDRLAPAVGTPL